MTTGVFAYGSPSLPDPKTPGEHKRFWQPPSTVNTPAPGPVKPTPKTPAVPSVWEKASECKHCGAPIYSRRDPQKPDAVPEVHFNCNCRMRDDGVKVPKRRKGAR